MEARVPSATRPDTTHVITRRGNKRYCSCPGFQFRQFCKHVPQTFHQKRIELSQVKKQAPELADLGRSAHESFHQTTEEKSAADPKLREFLNAVS